MKLLILLLRTDRIGDMLITTPAIRALRMAMPNALIDMMASPLNYPAIRDNPYLNNIFLYQLRRPWTWPLTALKIRGRAYDAALVFNSNSRNLSHFCSWLGIPVCIAMGGIPRRHAYSAQAPAGGESHVILDMLAKLEKMGIPSQSSHMDFVVSPQARERMSARFPLRVGVTRIAIFLGNIKKIHNRWPVEKFRALTSQLLESELDLEIILLGGRLEEALLRHFNDITHPRLLRFISAELEDTGALLQSCRALITSSSGPLHLAAALDVPVLAAISHYSAEGWRPLNERDRIVIPDSIVIADKRGYQDMRGIPVDRVLGMVRDFLKETGKQGAVPTPTSTYSG